MKWQSGWWFGTFLFFHILGMSSSQLTFIFFRGVELNHQPAMNWGSITSIPPLDDREPPWIESPAFDPRPKNEPLGCHGETHSAKERMVPRGTSRKE